MVMLSMAKGYTIPALIVLNKKGQEVFRYVGKNNRDRYPFQKFIQKNKTPRKETALKVKTNLTKRYLLLLDVIYIRSNARKTADIKTSLNFRKNQLKKLHQAILDYEGQLYEALFKDLGKSKVESYATEIGFVLSEINFCIKKLNRWMKPKRVRSNWLLFLFSSSHIHQEPLGKILIISPWNYPFMLSIFSRYWSACCRQSGYPETL